MDPPRIILHLDMDSFFASIEVREHPELQGRPVVVGADPKAGKGRGVVSTSSYEARKFGILSGMPISRAYALCPDAVFLPVNYPLYARVSEEIMNILGTCTGELHQVSIDEAYLDLSSLGSYRAAEDLAGRIKDKIRRKEHLTCSVGIGPSRIVAKIASDLRKPDGLTVVEPEEVLAFLAPLPVGKIPGIGRKTAGELERMGILTIGDLGRWDVQALQERFGRWGLSMHELAQGRDIREAHGNGAARSISREVTFDEDTEDPRTLLEALDEMAAALHGILMDEGILFRTVTVKVRYTGFITRTRSLTILRGTQDLGILGETSRELLKSFPGGRTIRLVGIRLSNLQEAGSSQRTITEFLRG